MRLWWKVLLGVLLLLVLAVATVPWWLGSAVRRLGPRYGVTLGAYHRLGYGRFAADDVVYRRPGVEVSVKHLECDTPAWWAWRHLSHSDGDVVAGDWSVVVTKRPPGVPSSPSTAANGWVPLRKTLFRVAAILNRWLPSARVGAGVVRWPTGQVGAAAARWHRGTLEAEQIQFRALTFGAAVVFDANEDLLTVRAQSPEQGLAASLESHAATLTGTVRWWDQPVTLQAGFAADGWMPPDFGLEADNIALPAAHAKLAPMYQTVTGHARAQWHRGQFFADVAANGIPAAGKSAPPLTVTVRSHGDAKQLTIDALHASLPGVVADLSSPISVDRAGRVSETTAHFSLRADLSQQHWVAAAGIVTGDASFASAVARIPTIAFRLSARDLTTARLRVAAADAHGTFEWPRLTVEALDVTTTGTDRLAAHGAWDFRAKTILAAAIDADLGEDSLGPWRPASLQFARVKVHATGSGPLAQLVHAGAAQVIGLHVAKLTPIDGNVSWRGTGPAAEALQAEATLGAATLRAAGAANAAGVRLTQLDYRDRAGLDFRLRAPTEITWRPTVAVRSLALEGGNAALDVDLVWGPAGKLQLVAKNIPSTALRNLVPFAGPAWTVASAAVNAHWDHAPMVFTSSAAVTFTVGDTRTAGATLALHGDDQGMVIEALHGVEAGNAVLNATGRLPFKITPGQTPLWTIDTAGALALDVESVSNAAFWQQVGKMTGLDLQDPRVQAHLRGTWQAPEGELQVLARRVAMDAKRFARPLPSVDDLQVALTADRSSVELKQFTFAIERQVVRASGHLPVPAGGWQQLQQNPRAFVQGGAQLHLEVPDAQIAMFSRFLPAALAPAGRFQADIRYDRGQLGGYLRLRDAASRPLGPLGVLQQINAEVGFSNHRVDLHEIVATAGGQPVTLTGSVELPSAGFFGGNGAEAAPRYDITLRGQNLPFVRQSGLLVRGDLALKLQTPDKGPPAITGQVTLRDSLFLADVRAFLPHGTGASPSRRPPFFAVDTPPLNTWTLGIDVTGARFLRLRTPVFSGVASAQFRLSGTLGEPRAIGGATIDEGQVLMPFAAFEVTQGNVRLTEDDPYEPSIYLRGTGRHYGYDLTMEISGKASAPNIVFTSSPALDPEQVLLMVMTGAAPNNDIATSTTHRAVQIGQFFGQGLIGTLTGGAATADRLTFESGEKISLQGKETQQIEYKLNDRWTLTGEYDEFDEYNVGFKWRLAPKSKH